MLEKTYAITPNAPVPLAWEEYERSAIEEWEKLINGSDSGDEGEIHAFLERNPSFIPGAFSYPVSGHYPIFGSVITKPPLAGVGTRIPDFMWLAQDSSSVYPVFVEIETPSKEWFTKSGHPTAAWTQARNQLVEWKQWIGRPANRLVFCDFYQLPERNRNDEFRPQFILVYGRRAEFDMRPDLRAKRAIQVFDGEVHMTYDRLLPDRNASNFLTARKQNMSLIAVTIPPTIRLGPGNADLWVGVEGRQEAALRETRMSEERRRFIANRFEYWEKWALNGRRGGYIAGEYE